MSKKARKRAAAAGVEYKPGAAEPTLDPELAPELGSPGGAAAELPTEFYFPPDEPPQPVSERELQLLMRDWRHGRATRTLLQALGDGYVNVLTVLVLGAMVVGGLLRTSAVAAVCDGASCQSARTLVPWVFLFGAFSLTLAAAHLFGPVLASAAEGFWLMDAPIRRAKLLGKRLVLPLVIALIIGAAGGAVVALATGLGPLGIAAWAGAVGIGSLGLMAFAAAAQTSEKQAAVKVLQGITSVFAVVTVVLVISVATGWMSLPLVPETSIPVAAGVAVAGLIVALVAGIYAARNLERIRRARLLSGGSLVSGMQGAAYALDLGLVRDILVDREMIARGHVKPTKGRGVGLQALIWRDLQRLWRSPKPLITLGVSLIVPYALDALGMGALNPLLSGLVLLAALVPFLGSLRVLSRTGGLARTFPFPTSQIRTAAMAVPALLAVVWALAATPAFIGISAAGQERTPLMGLLAALVAAVAGLMGAVRWVSAKQVDFGAPMMATAAGAMPPSLIFNLIRGLDMVILICAPLLFGADPWWSLALAGLVFVFLRGTFNMEELKATQERQQREQEALKAAQGQKIKVSRPQR